MTFSLISPMQWPATAPLARRGLGIPESVVAGPPQPPVSEGGPRPATVVDEKGVSFWLHDLTGEISAVSLVQEVAVPRAGPDLRPAGNGMWRVRFDRPEVDRFEYRFELRWPGGERDVVLDPNNPKQAPGAFGARSVIEFPEYKAPAWLDADPPQGTVLDLSLPSALLGGPQTCRLWACYGSEADLSLPLLVALDGIEFEQFSGLLHFLDATSEAGSLPPMRALLMHPSRRDEHYSASPDFPRALEEEILPAVSRLAPIAAGRRYCAGLGASLGGLALMHAERSRPETFGGLFLQSSSFLHHGYMLGFKYYRRVGDFLTELLEGEAVGEPADIVLTCGTVEFSRSNNIAVAEALERRGNRVHMQLLKDAHNWIAWRDAWAPHLVKLLGECFG
jgi:enterochelin esterase family protein